VAVDLHRQAASAVSLDADGRAGSALPLPVEYPIGLTGCRGRLWLTGATGATGTSQPLLLELERSASAKAVGPIPTAGVLSYGPRPLCLEDRLVLLWETVTEGLSRLHLSNATSSSTASAMTRDLPGLTTALDAGSSGGNLMVARVFGAEASLRLTSLGPDLAEQRSVWLADGAIETALAAADGRVAVAWLTAQELVLQWLDGSGNVIGEPSLLASTSPGAVPRSLRAISGEDGRLALLYRVLRLGDARSAGGGAELGPPERQVEDFLCLVAPGATGAAVHERLPPGSSGGATGGWLGNRFLLFRGGQDDAVSVYGAASAGQL